MWLAKISIRHDCVIGNRCKKFKVQTVGAPFNVYNLKGKTYAPQLQTLSGTDSNIKKFIEDLRHDSRVTNLETEGNMIFFLEVRKESIPSSFFDPKLIFAKPVKVDLEGFEHWELASWDKNNLMEFIRKTKQSFPQHKLVRIQEIKLRDTYFTHIAPKLSPNQKEALEIAIKEGYYHYPRQIELRKLASIMKISLATYREHLRRAEEKIIPDLLSSI